MTTPDPAPAGSSRGGPSEVSGSEVARGLELIARQRSGLPRPVACCLYHEEPTPLISTMIFNRYEFYCLDCGCKFGFLEPRMAEPEPDVLARLKSYEAEWDEHIVGKLTVEGREPFDEEGQRVALQWLHDRVRRKVSP